MKEQNGYSALARVYDRLNEEIDYVGWADFFESCFEKFLPAKPELILDLACGTGRMTRELASRGYDMIGVDASVEMLMQATAKALPEQRILYLLQDMRSFELYGTVGAVTCCLDSLNYLLAEKDLLTCFRTVHNYLDPNGLFLFDLNTPYKFREIYGQNAYVLEDTLSEADDRAIYCGWQNDFDTESGVCSFELSIFEEQPDGSYRRSDEHQEERCYPIETVRNLLKTAGFESVGVWEDRNFTPPGDTAKRWYFCARAIKSAVEVEKS